MWIVAKIKKKEIENFKKDLNKKIGSCAQFYYPKVEYDYYTKNKYKKLEKPILENYIFCFHQKFSNRIFINQLNFTKGLSYFLNGNLENQAEIIRFINCCKCHENNEGYLTQTFFKILIQKKAEFISGPFTNMMFEILEKQKNKLKIIVGNIVTTISDNTNYLYRSS